MIKGLSTPPSSLILNDLRLSGTPLPLLLSPKLNSIYVRKQMTSKRDKKQTNKQTTKPENKQRNNSFFSGQRFTDIIEVKKELRILKKITDLKI